MYLFPGLSIHSQTCLCYICTGEELFAVWFVVSRLHTYGWLTFAPFSRGIVFPSFLTFHFCVKKLKLQHKYACRFERRNGVCIVLYDRQKIEYSNIALHWVCSGKSNQAMRVFYFRGCLRKK